ncbi:ImmA/IrrE family metallo-endopeptidase [Lysinibacillus sp. BSL11]
MFLKEYVANLINKYATRDPFELATLLNIYIIKWNLHEEIRGYYKYDRRNKYIVINSNLSDEWKRIVCAHELGHAILHPRLNTPFMRKSTLFSVDKIEREANLFAAYLLIPDENLFEYYGEMTIYDIAALHQIPIELIRLIFNDYF